MSKNLSRQYFDGYLDEESFVKIYCFKENENESEPRHIVRVAKRPRRHDDEVWKVEEQRLLAGTVSNARSR
jgi:hypothetical protein